jgi:putative flippase GtrA
VIPQILRFGVVGVVGYVVDTGVLLLLVQRASMAPLSARITSFIVAASATFVLNHRFTFRMSDKPSLQRWAFYLATTAVGALINIGTYQAWIVHNGTESLQLAIGTAAGSLAAMAVNYVVSSTLVFRQTKQA